MKRTKHEKLTKSEVKQLHGHITGYLKTSGALSTAQKRYLCKEFRITDTTIRRHVDIVAHNAHVTRAKSNGVAPPPRSDTARARTALTPNAPVTSMVHGPLVVVAFRYDTPLEIVFAGVANAVAKK